MRNPPRYTWWERWILDRFGAGKSRMRDIKWVDVSAGRRAWSPVEVTIHLTSVREWSRQVRLRVGPFAWFWCPNNTWEQDGFLGFYGSRRSLYARWVFRTFTLSFDLSIPLHRIESALNLCHCARRGDCYLKKE